ncbi:MAG TPA: LysR family transcriptional regulator [Burkholderiaceae bacterium]|nr:LysR family transcriptional regulator [Burkholderiaceae bacterium]
MARLFDDVMLGSIELFCLAAELESFTAAATASGLTPAAVSRSISRLEARLGVPLFVRSTRKIRLTESGRAYLLQCRQALNQLVEAEREVTGQQQVPAGTVRISMATPFAHYRVLPLVAAFRAQYPAVRVEAHLGNRNIDFAAEGYDLAIRGRVPPDSGLVARKLEDAELVVVAAPAYLARMGPPQTPEALDAHDCIQFILPRSGQPIPWMFQRDGVDFEVATQGGTCCLEDPQGGVTLARHGAGLVQTYRFLAQEALAQGQLVEVLQAWGGRSRPFSLLYPQNRHIPLRVRVFIDYLVQKLRPADAAL